VLIRITMSGETALVHLEQCGAARGRPRDIR
jgi:hypothetical protein